jgi:hypothetical protein
MDPERQAEFPFAGPRRVRTVFDGGALSSDGGAPLLREAERRVGIIERLAGLVCDTRDPRYVTHSLAELLSQRIYGICLGYEDCNDFTTLRHDPVLQTLCGRDPGGGSDAALASQPTLSRLENSFGPEGASLITAALVDHYGGRQPRRPRRIVLDIDLTDDPVHGQQELAFFRSHYDNYIYLPLLVFDERGDLITVVLLPGDAQGPRVLAPIVRGVIERLRARWPGIPVLVRGDSGMSGPEMFDACDELKADFVLGFAPNSRLKVLAAKAQEKARRRFLRTGHKARVFTSVRYRARKRWSRSYRVVVKAEHHAQGPNVRFVITTLRGRPEAIYDDCYVQRAEASENSIKDLKRALKADRLSCSQFWANQFRLFLHAAAYVLMYTLRRAATGTELAEAQMDTLRLRLLKIGARIESSARRIWFHLSSSHPWRELWLLIARRLGAT